jgi:hypothetical protein
MGKIDKLEKRKKGGNTGLNHETNESARGRNLQKLRHGWDLNRGPHAWQQGAFTTTLQLNLCILHVLTSFVLVLPPAKSALAARV